MLKDIKNYDIINIIKLTNRIIDGQYGVKIRKKGKSKINISYYICTCETWNKLPNRDKTKLIISKDLIEMFIKNENKKHLLADLDDNLFVNTDSSDSD